MLFLEFTAKLEEVTQGTNLVKEHQSIPPKQKQFFEIFCLQVTLLYTEFLKNQLVKTEELIASA